MIVIKEQDLKKIIELEKVYNICSDDVFVGKKNLKISLLKEINYLKWKVDRLKVENWCREKNIDLLYFEKEVEYNKWNNIENYKDIQENHLEVLRKRQNRQIRNIKKMKRHIKEKIKERQQIEQDLILEIKLMELDSFHVADKNLLNVKIANS